MERNNLDSKKVIYILMENISSMMFSFSKQAYFILEERSGSENGTLKCLKRELQS
jgi:hypothetical protein